MKIQQLKNGQFFLNLPLAIVRAKGWRKGDVVNYTIDKNGDLVLKKKE